LFACCLNGKKGAQTHFVGLFVRLVSVDSSKRSFLEFV